jgi:WD repeat-containing protein 35
MFVYLSKKIAIPNGVKLRSIAWNHDQGWIACGGENGLLKVLKLDNGQPNSNAKGGSNLSMNQTLEGHERALSVVAWNDQYRKLTSSDENGLIIVWTLHRGMWFEEMINNRNRSVVKDLGWNHDGQKVCIVYEDGAVIVGGVDGNRLWGKETKKTLTKVTWSPDGRFILFGIANGEVHVHDANAGQYLSKVNIMCVDEGEQKLAGLQWHPAFADSPEPAAGLAICYENGKMQLMRNDADEKPYLIDTGLTVTSIRWNPQGTVLAVAGIPTLQSTGDRAVVVTQFFSNMGVHLRTLRVPGTLCGGVAWEGNGLRIALAVDSFIYFANVRPDYKYTYFSKTCVYAFQRPERAETSVMFWNVKSNEKTIKQIRHLTHLNAAGDACLLVSKQDDIQQCVVQLVNSIGGPMETRYIDMEPLYCSMNESHVVCCGEENVYVWQYRNPSASVDALDPVSMAASRRETTERMVHVDEIVTEDSMPNMQAKKAITNDLVCAVCCSNTYAFVARESGLLQIYRLNELKLVCKYTLANRAQLLTVNSNSTTLGVVDLGGTLTLVPLIPEQFSVISRPAQTLQFERKDVWNMMWASDNPEMFAVMEKTRMYIFRGLEPEEPVQSSAHICKFKSLRVRAVSLDDAMQDPEKPNKDLMVDFETKSLRDTRDILASVSIKDAFQYVEDHPHPKLWGLLAEHSLGQLDFAHAEKAVIRCKEYPAIQFVKRVKSLDDPNKQKAEVHAYYHRFDEAEKIYKEMDRKDLALELRARLGDWFRVVQLVHEGAGDDSVMVRAWEQIGDFYADRQKWSKATQYYSQCKHHRKLAGVYYIMEDFKNLEKIIDAAGHDKELLMTLGGMFLSVGLAESAVNAFLAANEVRKAVDACVELNQWDQAVMLAEKHQLSDISQYLSKYASHLVDKERVPQAIELFRKAGQHGEAAKLLSKLAQTVASQGEPLKAKKFYVLSALEVEKFRKRQLALQAKSANQVVDDLLSADRATSSDRSLDAAWRGAEAFHFFLLCQQFLLQGNIDTAVVIAMRLMEYDDLIDVSDSYSLIALTSYLNKNYGLCSKAFTRLESLEMGDDYDVGVGELSMIDFTSELDVTKKTRAPQGATLAANPTMAAGATMAGTMLTSTVATLTATGKVATYPTISLNDHTRKFGDLAVKLFTKHSPVDTSLDRVKCPSCGTFNKEWSSQCTRCQQPFVACIASGKAIVDHNVWQCNVCHHRALENEVGKYKNCPLCHSARRH